MSLFRWLHGKMRAHRIYLNTIVVIHAKLLKAVLDSTGNTPINNDKKFVRDRVQTPAITVEVYFILNFILRQAHMLMFSA